MLYYISDIHFDVREKFSEEILLIHFFECINKLKEGDCLIIAGDVYNDHDKCIGFFRHLIRIALQKNFYIVFSLGNHDCWDMCLDINAEEAFKHLYIKETSFEVILEDFKELDERFSRVFTCLDFHSEGVTFNIKTGRNNIKPVIFYGCNGWNVLNNSFELSAFHGIYEYRSNLKALECKIQNKYFEWIKTYKDLFNNPITANATNIIIVTHQPTWTWMSGSSLTKKEKELNQNWKYVNGHDHYFAGATNTPRCFMHGKLGNHGNTAINEFNSNQICYDGDVIEFKKIKL